MSAGLVFDIAWEQYMCHLFIEAFILLLNFLPLFISRHSSCLHNALTYDVIKEGEVRSQCFLFNMFYRITNSDYIYYYKS